MKFRNLRHFITDSKPSVLYVNGYRQGFSLITDNMPNWFSRRYINDELYTVSVYQNNKRTGYGYIINRHYKYNKQRMIKYQHENGKLSGQYLEKTKNRIKIQTYMNDNLFGKSYEYANKTLIYYRNYPNNMHIRQGLIFRIHNYRCENEYHEYARYNTIGALHGRQTKIYPNTREVVITYYNDSNLVSTHNYRNGIKM